jgi:hypothetical protein
MFKIDTTDLEAFIEQKVRAAVAEALGVFTAFLVVATCERRTKDARFDARGSRATRSSGSCSTSLLGRRPSSENRPSSNSPVPFDFQLVATR